MDHIIYTSMTGASAAAQRQAVLANNLANASTNGFRAEMSTFRSVPVQGRRLQDPRVRAGGDLRPRGNARPRAAHRPQPGCDGGGQRVVRGAGAGRHRGLHPQRQLRGECGGPAAHFQRAHRAVGRRRPDRRAARRRRDAGLGRHPHRARGGPAGHADRKAQARHPDAGRPAQAGRRRALFAPHRATRYPTTRTRGCCPARWRAPT